MAEQSAWQRYRSGVVDAPADNASDADVPASLRTVENTEHHPTSTCRRGVDDGAVTDLN
jgi:choline dehydrogenase